MVVHVFNSGVISGPETLVLPALPLFREPQAVVFLVERRLGEKGRAPAEFARSCGLRVETVEVASRLDPGAIRRLRETLRRLNPKIVHAHDVKATTYAWLASRGEGWKRVSTHHGVAGRPDLKTKAYENFYSRLVLPRMDMAVAVSRDDENTLRRRGLDRLSYVANGVTRRLWAGAERAAERLRIRSAWRSELGDFSDNTVLIGMVARLSAEKRHLHLLRALAEIRRDRPDLDWRFLAVGSGALEAQLKRATEELGLSRNVTWLGYRNDASTLMPGFDLVAFASSAEGLPIAALEAGWAGVPLFTSDVGGLPELVGTGDAAGGLVFPREQEAAQTAKSLVWLLEHAVEREKMGPRLQNRVAEEYSARAWVERMEAIYQSL